MAITNGGTKKWNTIAALIAALIIGIALGERAGWPFLAAPLEKQLSSLLNRAVSFDSKNTLNLPDNNGNVFTKIKPFQVRFIGGLTLSAAKLNIAKPAWSKKPHFIDAKNITLKLRYVDLWHAYRGLPLRIKSLRAAQFDGYLERRSDGRASWQFRDKPVDADKSVQLPSFDELMLANGLLHVDDDPLKAKIEAKLSLTNNSIKAQSVRLKNNSEKNRIELNKTDKSKQSNSAVKNSAVKNSRLKVDATGSFKDLPLKIELVGTGVLPASDASKKLPVAMKFNATVGRANLRFKGTTTDIMRLHDFAGSYALKGPSLAAVGDLFNVTLPTTAAFNTDGVIEKQDALWRAKVHQISIGDSRLNGQFSYDRSPKVPMLKGRLGGKKLVITDLGPAFGTTASAKNPNKVLPTRPFDLASLRVMNADVVIDIQYLDLKTQLLQPLNPLQGHLQLKNAVLTLSNIKASTSDGLLKGDMRLDGRGSNALWDADMRWSGVRLEQWVKQTRKKGEPPYIAGKLNGNAVLKGQGKSTAEILASLTGHIRSELHQGAVSHLAIEVAGIDLAQSIGVLFKGDDALTVQCAVVDLQAKNGLFTPRVMVVDTDDTTVWVDGSLSLATETLNLRARALPKDFSPLTVRTPVNVTGHFANPQVSLDKKPIGLKLAASVVLAVINPLAAVIPLLDTGDTKLAKKHAAECASAMKAI